MNKKEVIIENIRLTKLVHGGQCIATIENPKDSNNTVQGRTLYGGKKIFVWGGLPNEVVDVRVIKKKGSYLDGIVTRIHESSPDRIEPQEPNSYLSTSPWQIMNFDAENKAKQAILAEAFEREGVEKLAWSPFVAGKNEVGYRNKQEFGFWGDDEGLNLAHYVRGTHGKQIIQSSLLTTDSINSAAVAVRDELRRLKVWGGDLKTLVLRCSAENEVVGALFIKKKLDLSTFVVPEELKGLVIYFSDPKSPASVPTKKLYSFGDITLSDSIMGKNITYDVLSFFQVNIPIFESAAKEILTEVKKYKKTFLEGRVVDMYSGVGTIGLIAGADVLVELEITNIKMAKANAKGTKINIVHASSERAIDEITSGACLIVDPPRAGLHKDVVDRILEVLPQKIIYLSCNPSTQARDVKYLQSKYKITSAQGFNFFPRTPHIEALVVLSRVDKH